MHVRTRSVNCGFIARDEFTRLLKDSSKHSTFSDTSLVKLLMLEVTSERSRSKFTYFRYRERRPYARARKRSL